MNVMSIYSRALEANLRNYQILYRCRLFKTPDPEQPPECVIVATRILWVDEFRGSVRIKLAESSPWASSTTDRCVADNGWRTTKKKAIEALEKRINNRRFFLNEELRELTRRSIALDALKSQLIGAKKCRTKDRTGNESQTSLS